MSRREIGAGRGVAVAVALAASTPAHAWWDVDWSSRSRLTFVNAAITADADDVVVMVKLDGSRIDYGDMQVDGDDLRFVDSNDSTELDYEVETWDPAGTSIVWVHVPRVEGAGTADSIYMYWGNLLAPPVQDPVATWNDGVVESVFHFDSTLENRLDGVPGILNLGAAVTAAKLDDGLDVDGIDDYFFSDTDVLWTTLKDDMTFEFWIKTTDVGSSNASLAPAVAGYQDNAKPNDAQVFGWLDNTGKIGLRYKAKQTLSTTAVNDGLWHHVALSRSADGDQKVYVDGALQTNNPGMGNEHQDSDPIIYKSIGRSGILAALHHLDGSVDEVRAHNLDRSDAWIKADYLSQADTLISYCALVAFAEDLDNDGYGDDGGATTLSCDAHPDFGLPTDCNDGNAAISPGDPELCDVANVDEDCDGLADNADAGATGKTTFYLDNDKDGFGQNGATTSQCDIIAGYAAAKDDCDDTDASEYPNAIWWTDADGDGYGKTGASIVSCLKVGADNDDDCNDADATINPETPWYDDDDGDGHGDPLDALASCTQPVGRVRDALDCKDTDKDVYTGAPEMCDGKDNDCDVTVDESPPSPYGTVYYTDADKDGHGVAGPTIRSCSAVAGFATSMDDCDDELASVHAGAAEDACNGVDDDCDLAGGPTDSSDGDALSWLVESAIGASDCSDDSDGDSIDDDTEYGASGTDSDFDGSPDIIDEDDDGDTIDTLIESAFNDPDADRNTCPGVIADDVPNHLDLDSDGDGLRDFNEGTKDSDKDGTPDYLDCSNFGCDGAVDLDQDGLDDCAELDLGLSDADADADDDGVADGVEVGDVTAPFDSDGDTIPDVLDADDDDDGVLTALEGDGDILPADTDRDGDQLPDYLDADDDGDGVSTLDEDRDGDGDGFDDDLDGDGVADFRDADDYDGPLVDGDGDGVTNGDEAGICANGDCLDPLDPDTDGDGVADGAELGDGAEPRDSDADGVPDALDPDDDGDGVPSAEEGTGDGDRDGQGAWLDPDSDDDGIGDGSESALTDADCDGLPDRHDAVADGACALGGEPVVGTEKPAGGCSTTGSGGAGWAALALALLVRRRR